MKIAWSKKVTNDFLAKVLKISKKIETDPDYLMSCMAFESAETFSPKIKNAAGSGATGLIQFMPRTAIALDTTTEKLLQMTAVEQLDYVEKYFMPYKGKLKMLSDVYMAILLPKAVGKPENYILFNNGEAYRQNSGLDINRDGQITKSEATAKVYDKYIKGLKVNYTREFIAVIPEEEIPEPKGIQPA